jgi:hypothetical protein
MTEHGDRLEAEARVDHVKAALLRLIGEAGEKEVVSALMDIFQESAVARGSESLGGQINLQVSRLLQQAYDLLH